MKTPALYLIVSFLLLSMANSCQTQNGSTWFAIRDLENRSVFHLADTLNLALSGSKGGKSADSAHWETNEQSLGTGLRLALPAKNLGLGAHRITTTIWHEEKQYQTTTDVVVLSDTEPRELSYQLINTFTHDTSAYTQGLFYTDGLLYESTGRKKESRMRITGLNGNVRNEFSLPDEYFGEGACMLEDKIYQLTWKGQKGFIYNRDLERVGEFSYPEPFDGWGLTSDGRYLILSDGTHRLRFLDPHDSMRVVRTVQVADHKQPVKLLNELEYVNGRVYANVYTKDYIVGIDPATGQVLEEIDFTGLLPKGARYPGFNEHNYVLNGIAHDPKSGHFFITGKKWPLLFEVRF